LSWGDAAAIIWQQPPHLSAVARALHPEEFDRTREVQVLEFLAVLVQRGNFLGAMNDVKESQLPHKFEDLFEKPKAQMAASEAEVLAQMAAIDARLSRPG
jgi:hypothetical protein